MTMATGAAASDGRELRDPRQPVALEERGDHPGLKVAHLLLKAREEERPGLGARGVSFRAF